MHDYHQIVSDIRSVLMRHTSKTELELRELALSYNAACAEVNERLRKCIFYLRNDYRSEAVRLCDLEPKLLPIVMELDFQQRPQWLQLYTKYEFDFPPELMMEEAIQLNEAYALEKDVAELLEKYRRRNLARAPLEKRINTLREIVDADPNTQVWRDELRNLQTLLADGF